MLTRNLNRRLRKLESVTLQAGEKLALTIVFVAAGGRIGSSVKIGGGPNGEDLWQEYDPPLSADNVP